MTTIYERMRMCQMCHAGRNGTCSSYCKDNVQVGMCLVAFRREQKAGVV